MKATKMFALMAVLAMAFAGVAVMAEQNDAASTNYVTCFAEGKNSDATPAYNGMMVFGYDDSSIIIDTTYMALGTATEFKVELTNNSTVPVTMTVGPISATNGKIVIDGAGKTGLFADTLTVKLFNYESDSTPLSTASLVTSTTIVDIHLMPNHNADWSKANGFDLSNTNETGATPADPAKADAKYVATTKNLRFEKFTLDENINAEFKMASDATYKLKGWSVNPSEKADIDFYPGDYTTEQIIMALAAGHILDGAGTTASPSYSPVPAATIVASGAQLDQVAHTVLLFAVYEKITYNVILGYGIDDDSHPKAGYGINDIAFPEASSTVKASVTSKVDADSFGTIRIQQTAIGQYTYGFTVYKSTEKDAAGEKVYSPATAGSDYVIKMVTNGVFKLSEVKADLLIVVAPVATEDPDAFDNTAYAFQIDAIANESSLGKVKLSLDLFDYKPLIGETTGDTPTKYVNDKIAIKGTYFKDLADGVRAYGNLDNCGQFEEDTNVNLYIDNSSTASNTTLIANQIAAKLTVNDDAVYDLVWTAAGTPAMGIYAAQGLWTQYSAVTAEDAGTSEEIYTPWALFTA